MEKEVRLTTSDNPYDPFTQWDEWLLYDTNKGYHTCARLASVTTLSDQLTDEENYDSVESGMDELIKYGVLDKDGNTIEYQKVYKNTKK